MVSTLWVIAVALAAGWIGYASGKRTANGRPDAAAGVKAEIADAAVTETAVVTADETAGETASLLEAQREASRNELLQTVGHLRHDWMNDIQVLSGYIQLKKYDYLLPYVEKIRAKMQNESSLAKLGVPSLIAYILTFRTECKEFELEVELPADIALNQLPIDVRTVESVVRQVTSGFRRHAQDYLDEPNVLGIEMAEEEEGLLLDFVYRGQYDEEALRTELDNELPAAHPGIDIEACELERGHAALAVRLPYEERISET
jgi:hypothetical protein